MTINEAASSLRRKFDPHYDPNHWIVSIGIGADRIGADRIVVYLVDDRWLSRIPAEWEGYPVETTVSGRMYLCGQEQP